jgi:hypothetical protein
VCGYTVSIVVKKNRDCSRYRYRIFTARSPEHLRQSLGLANHRLGIAESRDFTDFVELSDLKGTDSSL